MYSKVFLTLLHCSLHTLIYQVFFYWTLFTLLIHRHQEELGVDGGCIKRPPWLTSELFNRWRCKCPNQLEQTAEVQSLSESVWLFVVHAASLPKTKCRTCPTCVSPFCTSCPLPTAVWTADRSWFLCKKLKGCWGHSFIVCFTSTKAVPFFLQWHKNEFIRGLKTKTESVSAPIHERKDKGGKTEAGSHFFNFCIQG